jgi:hypothetical protein
MTAIRAVVNKLRFGKMCASGTGVARRRSLKGDLTVEAREVVQEWRHKMLNVGDDQHAATAAQQPLAAGCLRRSTC